MIGEITNLITGLVFKIFSFVFKIVAKYVSNASPGELLLVIILFFGIIMYRNLKKKTDNIKITKKKGFN